VWERWKVSLPHMRGPNAQLVALSRQRGLLDHAKDLSNEAMAPSKRNLRRFISD